MVCLFEAFVLVWVIVFRKQRSGRWPDGLVVFEFLTFFVGGNTEVFSSSKILNDFTK